MPAAALVLLVAACATEPSSSELRAGTAPRPTARQYPKRAELFANLGTQQLISGAAANAAASFKKALDFDPKSASGSIGMGEIALRQGLFGDAIAHLQKP
jgi:Tfp pilus assembly protein PilF